MNRSIRTFHLILFFLLVSLHPALSQDSLLVKGKIFGNKNTPLKDISVSVEGMGETPVLTNEQGEFTIKVPSGNEWLIINPIGNYKGKRIFLSGRENIVISLPSQDIKSGYDEVMVTNQSVKRRDIVSAHTQMGEAEIKRKNIVTIDQALQGEVPGMLVTNHSGMPGKGTVNYLRGIQSMNASNAPLFLLNGMPIEKPGLFRSNVAGNTYNPLTNIDPSDITNITVLKDPTFTTLYGSKASNGIVLIETLQPQATQTSITISAQTGLNMAPGYIPQLNDRQYKSLANEILISSPQLEETFEEEYPGLYLHPNQDEYYKYIHNTTWQKHIFSDATLRNVYFNVKGGSEIARYGLSVGYHDQGGVFENSNYNRFNVLFVGRLNIFAWLRMDVNANLTNNNSRSFESAISPQTSPVFTSLAKPPIMNPFRYDDEGTELAHIDEVDNLGTSNPYAVANNFQGENRNYRLISSVKGEADISESLQWITLFGINFNTLEEYVYKPNIGMEEYAQGEANNVSQGLNNYFFSFYTDNYLSFDKQINSIHNLSSYLGFRVLTNQFQEDFGETMNLPANDQYTNLQSGQGNLRHINGANEVWNWMSIYNRISYTLKDRYIINTGLSADFSTRTGKEAETAFTVNNMPFGVFYSLGGGWRISEESLFKNVRGLDNLMLRASYGISGNDDIGVYNALNYYEMTRYRETSGLIPGTLPNRSLIYEKVKQMNVGMDLALWGNRTSLSANYFNFTTEDMLVFEPQSVYTGYDFRPTNSGEMQNTGVDFSAFQRIVDGTNFTWDVHANLSLLTNKVTNIRGNELITPFTGGSYISREGQAVNEFYGFEFDGVYATNAEADSAGLVNDKQIPYRAGDAIYKDVSGPGNEPDSVINFHDRVSLGSPIPDYFGSLSNSFTYKRWGLDVMLQFVYGNEVFNYTRYLNERMVDLSNQSTHVLNRWQYEGHETNVPRASFRDPMGNTAFSSRWIEDGSYLRVKNITLSYTIPDEFLVFKDARFYVTATNVFTLDNYLGYDPEFSYSYDIRDQGIDYGLMPQFKTYLLGVKFGL